MDLSTYYEVLPYGLAFLLALLVFKSLLKGESTYWKSRGVPTVDLSQFGSSWERSTQVLAPDELEKKIYASAKAQGAKFFGLIQNGVPVFIPLDLDLVKAIAVKDFEHFRNRRILLPPLEFEPLAKMNLLSAKDQEWRDLRSVVGATFSPLKLQDMFPAFLKSSENMEAFLRSKGSAEIEFVDVFARYTVDVIAAIAFGLASNTFQDSEFYRMATRFQNQFSSVWGRFKLFLILTCPGPFKAIGWSLADRGVFQFFVQTIKQTMAHRRKSGERRNDFLQHLADVMESRKPVVLGRALREEQVYSHCLLFFLGGFESVQSLLNYTAYELALNQELQEELHAEIKAHAPVTYQSLGKMELLERCISETLRKYPSIRNDRLCNEDYKVPDSDVVIRKGTVVSFPAYGLHHDPELFPEPDKYDPDRFLPKNKENRNPFSYHPFGHGPRACIGRPFALIEGKAAIAQLILKFRLETGPNTEIPLQNEMISVVLKPKNGLFLRAIPRN